MRNTLLTIVLLIIGQVAFTQNYVPEWATYFGDSGLSIAASAEYQGNLYLAGKANNSSFTGTLNSDDNFQFPMGAGGQDAFIAKFSPQGQLLWFTYYGGEGDDEISDIKVNEYAVIVVGKTASIGMGSIGVHQIALDGISDGFIASFDEEGNRNWHTYFGGENEDRIISLVLVKDSIYLYGNTNSHNNISTLGAFQQTIAATGEVGNYRNYFVAEFSNTGLLFWATYYGIPGALSTFEVITTPITGISANESGIYLSGWDTGVSNWTYFGTPGAFLESKPSSTLGMSLYLSKFSFDGGRLWSTYFSAYSSSGSAVSIFPSFSSNSIDSSHPLTANANGIYISGRTAALGIGTEFAFQPMKTGASTYFITHFADNGQRLWGSYLGNGTDGSETGSLNRLTHDNLGNIYISGATSRITDIATINGYQIDKNGESDFFTAKISDDGTTKLYGTYYGGSGVERDGYLLPLEDGNSFYLIGSTESANNITTAGVWQEAMNYGGREPKNILISKFTSSEDLRLTDLLETNVVVYPNPNKGTFTISSDKNNIRKLVIYTTLGQLVKEVISREMSEVGIRNLDKGLYFVKIIFEDFVEKTLKIIVN